jgi:hypothetical protein
LPEGQHLDAEGLATVDQAIAHEQERVEARDVARSLVRHDPGHPADRRDLLAGHGKRRLARVVDDAQPSACCRRNISIAGAKSPSGSPHAFA